MLVGGGVVDYIKDGVGGKWRLNHSVEESRDVLASVTGVTALDEVGELSVGPSTCGAPIKKRHANKTHQLSVTTDMRLHDLDLPLGLESLKG